MKGLILFHDRDSESRSVTHLGISTQKIAYRSFNYCSSTHQLLYFNFNTLVLYVCPSTTVFKSINYCILVDQLYYPFLCSEGISASDSQSLMGVWAYIAPVSHNFYLIFIFKLYLFISYLLFISYAKDYNFKHFNVHEGNLAYKNRCA
jgi:hypothetical protein